MPDSICVADERTRPALDLLGRIDHRILVVLSPFVKRSSAHELNPPLPLDANITRTYMFGRNPKRGRRRVRISLVSLPLFVTFLSLICGRCVAVLPLFSRCSVAVNSAVFSTEIERIQWPMKFMNFLGGNRLAVRPVGAKSVIARNGATKQSR